MNLNANTGVHHNNVHENVNLNIFKRTPHPHDVSSPSDKLKTYQILRSQ